jgi:hypothetical protein
MAFKQEGVTSFDVDKKARPFRFQISVVDDKLAMWFEDTETKQQWYGSPVGWMWAALAEDTYLTPAIRRHATALTVADFVDSQSVIPYAQPTDYAEVYYYGL